VPKIPIAQSIKNILYRLKDKGEKGVLLVPQVRGGGDAGKS